MVYPAFRIYKTSLIGLMRYRQRWFPFCFLIHYVYVDGLQKPIHYTGTTMRWSLTWFVEECQRNTTGS